MPTLVELKKPTDRKDYIQSQLGRVFYREDLRKLVVDLQQKSNFSDITARRLISSAHRLNAEWLNWQEPFLYSFQEPTNVFEILQAICARPGFYLSHYTAIYLNDLVEQRPREHFVTHERKGKVVVSAKGPLNPFNVRQAFLKPARTTKNQFTVLDQKISMLEKPWLDGAGVEKKTMTFEDQELALSVTGVHRTFLDSVIAPHQSGGVATVVKAFRNQKLEADQLFELYQKLNPIYPIWQSVGFLLQNFGLEKETTRWARRFSDREKIPFFLAHEARSSWAISKEWNLSYPTGIL